MKFRRSVVTVVIALASVVLIDCADQADAALSPQSGGRCRRTTDCSSPNEICGLSVDANGERRCAPPTGRCNPEIDVSVQCYEGARCDTTAVPTGGVCTFRSPPRAPFAVSARVTLESPANDAEIEPAQGISFRWQPPTAWPGGVHVAAVLRAPPRLEPGVNRIENAADVVWIWSTALPTAGSMGGATAGSVAARWGRAGIDADGNPGASWARDTLDRGVYWWLAYTVVDGRVVAASVVNRFFVGPTRTTGGSCQMVTECVEAGGDPEQFACVDSRCFRRCASEFDCPEAETVCALGVSLGTLGLSSASRGLVRGAFCLRTGTFGDAGLTTDGSGDAH